MGMHALTVRAVMTPTPVTIGMDQPLALAHRMLREHAIRHLPVLDGERLVGVVTMRDLHFMETLRDVDPTTVRVVEAMSPKPFAVTPRTQVNTVAREMARRKIGSAVVVEHGKVVGVFTTVDALRVLCRLLEREAHA